MNDLSDNIEKLLCDINTNSNNAIQEIETHTLIFLQQYKNDNLLDLIQKASQRGYSGIEWIDFWGVGGMNSDVIIKWAYNIIVEQKLREIIEPYYNNINHRLGILIKRFYIHGKPRFLPMELRGNIKSVSIKKCVSASDVKENNTLSLNKELSDTYEENDTDEENDTADNGENINEKNEDNTGSTIVDEIAATLNDSHFEETINENQQFCVLEK